MPSHSDAERAQAQMGRSGARQPGYLGRCWAIADENIRRYKAALDAALRGEGKANPMICREMIDKWLEYRQAHGPNDEAQL